MITKQLSVFLENAAGHFLGLSKALGDAGVNISAVSLAETAEYGVARMILAETDRGAQVLRDAGYSVHITDVLRVQTPDEPGALARILATLAEAGVNVSYIYGYSAGGAAYLIMKVEDPAQAAALLQKSAK